MLTNLFYKWATGPYASETYTTYNALLVIIVRSVYTIARVSAGIGDDDDNDVGCGNNGNGGDDDFDE